MQDDDFEAFSDSTVVTLDEAEHSTSFTLIVVGASSPATHVLSRPEIVIGRDDGCDVVVRHPSLSRHHAVLRVGEQISIEDLQSSNGTFVSGARIAPGRVTPIGLGEAVRIGSITIVVVGSGSSEVAAPQPPAPEAAPSRERDRMHLLTAEQRRRFDSDGYLVVPNALSPARLQALHAAIDRAIGPEGKGREHNRAAILGLDKAFRDMVDLETIFPKICQLLGWNIWVNHTHFNVNPPEQSMRDFMYGWHRDGGAIHPDLGAHDEKAPLLAIKVGFYLTDVDERGRGQTYVVPGGHVAPPGDPTTAALLRRDGPWARSAIPDNAVPLSCKAGAAVIFHNRLIHSVRSPNTSPYERRALFVQWAHRWMQPVDPMDVQMVESIVRDPIRRQLLGFGADEVFVDGYAQGRSRRYYPSVDSVPIRRYCVDTLGLPETGAPW